MVIQELNSQNLKNDSSLGPTGVFSLQSDSKGNAEYS